MEHVTTLTLVRDIIQLPKVKAVQMHMDGAIYKISIKSKWRWRNYAGTDIHQLMSDIRTNHAFY